ncbi:HlyD family secretion protein [Phaeovulum vinaykumarii]|uniref:HlyD family secretion protein n=1 Tax=Phaeovulum vinaykumarii TaxID=407234 RepID=A0A1N7JW20_9RHOB|nr:HlyD family efflux transporter periplasmic adaptor subunit [Phaeovulum vinaykumarii]SIS53533.1 HlyD family secretion protein [Phaeovulum vinaykumarii]SOB91622.1 HlyD family secretion protein [Phaeovulum vinaykumarii]
MTRSRISRFLGLALVCGLVLPAPLRAEGAFDALIARFSGVDEAVGIARSNGRIEAQSIDVAGKFGGRLTEVTAAEGTMVEAGDVLARIDDRDAQARVLAAKASVLQARAARAQAEAAVMQAESARDVARTTLARVRKLHADGHAAQAQLDDATNALTAAEAALAAARAQVENGTALIAAAEAQLKQAEIALDDLTIRAPIRGRVLYRLHEPGEVIAAGTPVVTLLDLTDVYMNIYLPASVVGILAMGDEARMVLDPIPQIVVPAHVTFIAPQAQFTPKAVETAEEREDLVFRVKLSVPRDLLVRYADQVKVGVRGLGFVRATPEADWPADLAVNVPG